MARFVSIMNHKMSGEQLEAALQIGEVLEIAFPNVAPNATSEDVAEMGDQLISQLHLQEGDVIQIGGEPTLTSYVVSKLFQLGYKVVTSTTERLSVEEVLPDGSTKKTNVFKFVQFREFVI
jgi:hypothetical protein